VPGATGRWAEAAARQVVAPAGSLLAYSGHALHAAGENRTALPRRCVVCAYMTHGSPEFARRQQRADSASMVAAAGAEVEGPWLSEATVRRLDDDGRRLLGMIVEPPKYKN
jgi:ectoine hydroxylase-related dioxygenase (phytanoyl-CoA dioxygenase family)